MISPKNTSPNILMLDGVQPQEVRRLQSPRGEITVWRMSPTVCASQVQGYLNRDMARLIIEVAEPLYANGTVAGFHDWFGMSGYDSQARVELTQWVMGHRSETRLHIGLHSKLVAMGVSVANLALGDMIKVHLEPADIRAAFERELAT